MLLDIALTRSDSSDVPAPWAPFVTRRNGGFRINGDPAAAVEIFLYASGDVAIAASALPELLDHLRAKRIVPNRSRFGISAVLHHGFVPLPYSEYEDIYFLGIGDIADVSWRDGGVTIDLSLDFPWFPDKSRQDSVPSEETLFELFMESVSREVSAANGRGFLMLSSGKDSSAIALALAEGGYTDIPCVTYVSGPEDPEGIVSADVCNRLGLKHQLVEMPTDADRTAAYLTDFFTNTARPGTDLAQIPYALAVGAADVPDGTVFDGGGNDAYMGFLASSAVKTKRRYRLRGRPLIEFAKRRVPVHSPLNYLTRNRVEALFPGRTARFHETSQFNPEAVDTSQYWYRMAAETRDWSPDDLLLVLRVRNVLVAASLKKHVLSAEANGFGYSVPWSDPAIADYYFNLPEEYRYDQSTGTNKILLRKMLARYLDYDAASVGKHYFLFDGARFVTENRDFIRSEIAGCKSWDQEGLAIAYRWLDQVERRPYAYHAVLALFLVSGWLNHSRYLRPIR